MEIIKKVKDAIVLTGERASDVLHSASEKMAKMKIINGGKD